MTKKTLFLPAILLSLSSNPCFSALAVESSDNTTWTITIQNPEEETLDINTSPNALVEDIKAIIHQEADIPVEIQKLFFEGKELKKGKKISDYDIEDRDRLDLVPSKQAGLMSFSFSSLKNKKMKKFSDKAPDWRFLVKGLNLEGICKNPSCKAYNKKVWVQKGFGTFNMAREIAKARCPMADCQKKVQEVDQCGFFYCKYEIEGMTVHNEEVSTSGSHKDENGFEKFLAGGDQSEEYVYLDITVSKH